MLKNVNNQKCVSQFIFLHEKKMTSVTYMYLEFFLLCWLLLLRLKELGRFFKMCQSVRLKLGHIAPSIDIAFLSICPGL